MIQFQYKFILVEKVAFLGSIKCLKTMSDICRFFLKSWFRDKFFSFGYSFFSFFLLQLCLRRKTKNLGTDFFLFSQKIKRKQAFKVKHNFKCFSKNKGQKIFFNEKYCIYNLISYRKIYIQEQSFFFFGQQFFQKKKMI